MKRRWLLQVIAGPNRGLTAELSESPSLIGAAPAAALVLTDDTVSRFHAELHLHPEGLRIRDLDSTNGTFLGGGLQIRGAFLENGGVFRVGETKIRVNAIDEAAQLSTDPQLAPEGPAQLTPDTVGASESTLALFHRVQQIAPSDAAILFIGEDGVGRKNLARALHHLSPRREGPFVSAKAEQLTARLEAHFVAAQGGSLMIQNVERLSPTVQKQLLRLLSQGEVFPEGASKASMLDVRLLSTSPMDLDDVMTLSPLLKRRLQVIRVSVPPLRARKEDAVLLARRFLKPRGLRLGPALQAAIEAQPWPKNISELREAIEAIPMQFPGGRRQPSVKIKNLRSIPMRTTHAFLQDLLREHEGNVSAAAQQLKLGVRALFALLHDYDVELDN